MDEKTIRYTIKTHGFEYHVKKCVMKASGCVISAKQHPIEEVEKLKQSLIEKRKVIKKENGYVLKSDYQTGLLMAYNLCSDKIESEIKGLPRIVINGDKNEDADIKDYFGIKNVIDLDSDFGKKIRKDECKLLKIEEMEYGSEFFAWAKDIDFSKSEEFVALCLKKTGIINDFRRGDAISKEADIVIEDEKRQIEIVNNLNYANDIFRFGREASGMSLVLDCIDTGHYGVNEGVLKKFTEKTYCEKYTKELAVLMIGTKDTAKAMMINVDAKIQDQSEIKNKFAKIHMVILNPIEDEIICVSGSKTTILPITDINPELYSKKIVELDNVLDQEMYLMTCKSLLDNSMGLMMLHGFEIKKIIKEMHIWI